VEPKPFAAIEQAMDSQRINHRPATRRAVSAVRRGGNLFAAACRKQTPAVLEKVLFFGGMAAVVYGCWMIYRPLGPLVGGALSVWLGMLISVERNEPRS
jgi:hypothetical protein